MTIISLNEYVYSAYLYKLYVTLLNIHIRGCLKQQPKAQRAKKHEEQSWNAS